MLMKTPKFLLSNRIHTIDQILIGSHLVILDIGSGNRVKQL